MAAMVEYLELRGSRRIRLLDWMLSRLKVNSPSSENMPKTPRLSALNGTSRSMRRRSWSRNRGSMESPLTRTKTTWLEWLYLMEW